MRMPVKKTPELGREFERKLLWLLQQPGFGPAFGRAVADQIAVLADFDDVHNTSRLSDLMLAAMAATANWLYVAQARPASNAEIRLEHMRRTSLTLAQGLEPQLSRLTKPGAFAVGAALRLGDADAWAAIVDFELDTFALAHFDAMLDSHPHPAGIEDAVLGDWYSYRPLFPSLESASQQALMLDAALFAVYAAPEVTSASPSGVGQWHGGDNTAMAGYEMFLGR